MKSKLTLVTATLLLLNNVAEADITPPDWCADAINTKQFCGYYKAATAQLASVRSLDHAQAKMCRALDCVQSANNGIGAAVHVSRDVGFKVINSIAIIDDGTVHHFTLIKAQ